MKEKSVGFKNTILSWIKTKRNPILSFGLVVQKYTDLRINKNIIKIRRWMVR